MKGSCSGIYNGISAEAWVKIDFPFLNQELQCLNFDLSRQQYSYSVSGVSNVLCQRVGL